MKPVTMLDLIPDAAEPFLRHALALAVLVLLVCLRLLTLLLGRLSA